MATKMAIEQKKCMTPEFRVSFPVVFEPKSYQGQPAKFSVTMLFDKKKADLKELKRAANNAAIEKWGADKTKWPKNLRSPFRDGSEKEDMMGYEGCTFVSASSKQRPGLVDKGGPGQKPTPILVDDGSFYAGSYARATLIAFAYDTAGNRGISFSLQNIQKLRDGEQFSGKRKAEDEFDSVEDNSDNPDAYDNNSGDDLGF